LAISRTRIISFFDLAGTITAMAIGRTIAVIFDGRITDTITTTVAIGLAVSGRFFGIASAIATGTLGRIILIILTAGTTTITFERTSRSRLTILRTADRILSKRCLETTKESIVIASKIDITNPIAAIL
jgi:hypothetical protein